MYEIIYTEDVIEDLRELRADKRAKILDTIEEQLTYEATKATRNKKILLNLVPPWEYIEPIWELRIDEYRAFYDVNEEDASVTIRAIRHKPAHKTTEEIL